MLINTFQAVGGGSRSSRGGGNPYYFSDMVGDRDVPHIYFSLDVNIRYKAFSACKAQSGAVSILVNRITDNYCLKIIISVYV